MIFVYLLSGLFRGWLLLAARFARLSPAGRSPRPGSRADRRIQEKPSYLHDAFAVPETSDPCAAAAPP